MMSEALRKAAEQAIKAIECGAGVPCWKAVKALREALAEPEQSEPSMGNSHSSKSPENRVFEQEPVDYRYKYLNFMGHEVWSYDLPTGQGSKVLEVQALYTTPPRREPLSDEQIQAIRAECVNTPPDKASTAYGWAINFAREIEQAHGIKPVCAPDQPGRR